MAEESTEPRRRSRFGREAARLEASVWIDGAVTGMAAAVELRDGYMAGHAEEVCELAAVVGRRLGMCEEELRQLGFAARLHDVGKIPIPDAILNKPGPLTPAEWETMRRHPVTGATALGAIDGLEQAAAMVRYHHERWDGAGYPDGLTGDEIPLGARIVAACDAYRAMVEERPYRRPLGPETALAVLEAESGTHFAPDVVAAIVRVLR